MTMHLAPTTNAHGCATTGCVTEPGDRECVIDAAAIAVVDPAPDREPVVLLAAVRDGDELFVDLDVNGQGARVRLDGLIAGLFDVGRVFRA